MPEPQIAWLDLEGASNVRDLGGLPAATGRTRHGVLLRSDALDALTEADVAVLAAVGVAHVVDLRTAAERAERGAGLLRSTGVTYSELEAFDDAVLARRRQARNAAFAAGVDPIAIMAEGYGELLELAGPTFATVLGRLVEPAGVPVAGPLLGRQGSHGRAGRAAARDGGGGAGGRGRRLRRDPAADGRASSPG